MHPDLHWFVPVPRPKAGEPDKQVAELEELLGAVLAERRASPRYGPPGGMSGHFVATARVLQRQAALTPVEGPRKVFILGHAERLVPQEANPEAANALLKLLEEPPADTLFVLTAADPGGVLPTIRSRTVRVRLSPLSDQEVEEFLRGWSPETPPGAVADRVAQAQGCIGAALAEDEAAKARRLATGLLAGVLAGPAARTEQVLRQPPWSARGEFTALLDALAASLHDATRAALGQKPRRRVEPEALTRRQPGMLLRATERVLAAREAAQGNLNPQLLLAALGDELARVL
jgi:DNA polymerase-3 subunit delta'